MNILKRLISITIVSLLFLYNITNIVYANTVSNNISPIKVAVFLNSFNDLFISNVRKSLEEIQKENNKVKFTFFDAKSNQGIQNEDIDKALNEDFNLLVINPVSSNISEFQETLYKIMQKNIPLIIYFIQNKSITDILKPYKKAVIIDTDINQSGIIQGKILAEAWNANKETYDKNKDNIMQYVMLKGPTNNPQTIARSKYSLQALNDAGINTEEISSITCSWDEDCAKSAIESLFLTAGNKIEAIISNNDAMAIGAIKAIQKYGYNKGGNSKYIPVVGIDALPEARTLVNQGLMIGTVIQDPNEHAKAIYTIGMNLISGFNPLRDTAYKFDESGITIRLPYYEYTKNNHS